MNWVKEVVGAIVPIVTIVGSLLGILIALDQITAGARLRRQAVFWRDMAAQDHALPNDVAAFHSLEREATAKVIALQALPARKALWHAIVITLAVTAAATLGFTIGQIPPSELSWATALAKATDETGLPLFLVLPFIVALAVIGIINLILLRAQIAKAYLDGRSLEIDRINRDDRSPIDVLGWTGIGQVIAVSLALVCIPAAVGGLAGTGPQTPSSPPGWLFLLLVVGSALMWPGFLLFINLQDHAVARWRHPRSLPKRRTTARRATPIGSGKTVHRIRRAPR